MSKTLLSVAIGNPCGACVTLTAIADALNKTNPEKSQTLLAMPPDAYLSLAVSVDAAFGMVVTSVEVDVRDVHGALIYKGSVQGPVAPGAVLLPVTLLGQADVAAPGPDVFSYSVRIWTMSRKTIHSYVANGPGSEQLRASEG